MRILLSLYRLRKSAARMFLRPTLALRQIALLISDLTEDLDLDY